MISPDRTPKRRFLLLTLIVIIASFSFIGLRGLWEPDEGRYVAVACEMVRTGDWLHPALNHELPHYTKPPLTYWLLALSMSVFGIVEWAVRLPSALAFAGSILCAGGIALRLAPKYAQNVRLMYSLTALPFVASNIITTDSLLTFFELLAILAFVNAAPEFRPPKHGQTPSDFSRSCKTPFHAKWLLLMWSAFGLAFMTKGPPGLLPLPAICLTIGLTSGFRSIRRIFSWWAIAPFFLIGFTWYTIIVRESPALGTYFIWDEVYARIFSGKHNRNSEWYMAFSYLPILLGGLLPWSFDWFRPTNLPKLKSTFRNLRNRPAGLFLFIWVLLPLIVFAISQSRLPLYVLPLIAPLIIATAHLKSPQWSNSIQGRKDLIICLTIFMMIRFGLGVMATERDDRRWLAHTPIDPAILEIVYVDLMPRYGLSFYLGIEIESVTLSKTIPDNSLAHELDELEGDLLFIGYPRRENEINHVIQDHRWEIVSIQHFEKFITIHARPPAAPDS